MKRITVRWHEQTTYEQTFEVDDDFDPEAWEALEDLIVEEAEWEGGNVSVSVEERDVIEYRIEGAA